MKGSKVAANHLSVVLSKDMSFLDSVSAASLVPAGRFYISTGPST